MVIQTTCASTDDPASAVRTVWGLDPYQLHDRFWAARGVQVVRQGERSQIVRDAELFLLCDPRTLTIFKIGWLVDQLSWLKPELMVVRLHESRDHGYSEKAETDHEGRFIRFERIYGTRSDSFQTRVALTPSRRIAEEWQAAEDPRSGWRLLRRRVRRNRRTAFSADGNVYDRSNPKEVMQCMRDLIRVWQTPDATIRQVKQSSSGVWADRDTRVDSSVRFIGPAWVGAGRQSFDSKSIVGPAVLWDDPEHRPAINDLEWLEIEPSSVFERAVKVGPRSTFYTITKRAFDIVFALVALAITLPIYPLVILAIWLEDGRPFFFAHRRETIGGREFPCIKFRSMRNDAEQIKIDLAASNVADGPQFYINEDKDPRVLRVGRLLRKLDIDELTQFINVLLGDMSVVGPRPSPRAENQCCPPWREARLSVRPGITGLWQVMRTRAEGLDFQEWIKFDIEYVEKANWRMDLFIIWKTILMFLKLGD